MKEEIIHIHPEDIACFSEVRVLVIGDVMLDEYTYGDAHKISPEAPIPVLEELSRIAMLGGAGNVCNNLVHLGGEFSLIAVIGVDDRGQHLKTLLREIDPTGESILIEDPSRPTTLKRRFVSKGQQLLRVDCESKAPLSTSLEDRIFDAAESKVPSYDILILSDYAKGVLSHSLTQRLIQLSKKQDCYVIIDPKGVCYKKYSGANVLKPNLEELSLATNLPVENEAEIIKAAYYLQKKYALDEVVVTRSSKGILGVSAAEDKVISWPSFAQEVIDVSGAGDTVISTLALCIANGMERKKALLIANHAACCVVEKVGTATLSADELFKQSSMDQFHTLQKSLFSLDEMQDKVKKWKQSGLKVGITNGCFDLLHPGHINLLRKGKKFCDRLIVALNSDASVAKLKGPTRPIQDEQARAILLLSLGLVDGVVLFSEETPQIVIESLTPDLLFKGGEYDPKMLVGADWVKKHGGHVEVIDSEYKVHTSELIKKIGSGKTSINVA